MKMTPSNEIATFVHELGESAELVGAQARAGLETLAGAALYLMQEGFGRVGGRRMAAALSALTGISMLLSACGPSQSGRQTGETQPVVTAVEPTETKLPPQIEPTPTAIILNKSEFGIVQSNETDPQKIKLEEKYAQTIIAEAKQRIASLSDVPEEDIQYLRLGRVMPDGSVATTAELILAKNSENPAINNLYLVSQINGSRVEEVYSPLFVDDTGELAKIVFIDPSTGDPEIWMEEIQGKPGKMKVYLLGGGTLEVELDLISAMSSGKSASLIDMSSMPQFAEGANGPEYKLGNKTYSLDIKTGQWVERVDGYMSQLDIIFESPEQELTYNGAQIHGQTSVDKSAGALRITELTIEPETQAELSMRALHNIFLPDEEDNEANLRAFTRKLAEVQNGTRDCIEFMRTVRMYDANGNGAASEMTIVPACGVSSVPEGATEVKSVNFITGIGADWNEDEQKYMPKSNMAWFNITTLTDVGSGIMFDKQTSTMNVFVGLSSSVSLDRTKLNVARSFEVALYWLKAISRGKGLMLKNYQSLEDRGQTWTGDLQIK